jgi:hypothetical protein
MSVGLWLTPEWTKVVVSVLPNLLGFTLGGYAMFMGFGSDDFKRAISGTSEDHSPYLSASSAFMLFVGIQMLALLYALVADSLYFSTPNALVQYLPAIDVLATLGGALGYFLFMYSLALALRAAIRVFRLTRWYNHYLLIASTKGDDLP